MRRSKADYDLFDLATYLIASARDCVDEPLIYGPLRMLVGVSRINEVGEGDPRLRDGFLLKAQSKISNDVLKVMSDRQKFKRALDELLLEFADELKHRTVGKPERLTAARGGRRPISRRRTP
jgi:hypothetical protein